MRAETSAAVYAAGMIGSNRMLRLTVACFVLQAMIPVGFMPGNLVHGEFATLCPSGLPKTMVAEFFGEHHAHHNDTPSFA